MQNLPSPHEVLPYKFVPTTIDAAVPRRLLDKEVARQLPAYWVIVVSSHNLSSEAYRFADTHLDAALDFCRTSRRAGNNPLLFHGTRVPLVQAEAAITAGSKREEYVVEFCDLDRDLGQMDPESVAEAEKAMDDRYREELRQGIPDSEIFTPAVMAAAVEIFDVSKFVPPEDFSI